MVVLDTSVVAKWFLEEDGSDRAVKIRDEFLNESIPIAICDLTLYELGIVPYKRRFDEQISWVSETP